MVVLKLQIVLLSILLFSLASSQNKCCDAGTIHTTGNSVLKIKPDVASISIRVQERGKTSNDALQALNKKVNSIVAIIQDENIPNKDYSVEYFSLVPDYTYTNSQREIVGQIASQTINVKIRGFDISGSTIGKFIDKATAVDGIQINGVNFDRQDKSGAKKDARKAALKDARTKAGQYASLSDQKLGRVLKITDTGSYSIYPIFRSVAQIKQDSTQTNVPVSLIQVTASVDTIWSLNFY